MRKLAQASTLLLLSGATTAMAAGVESGFGEARLYWRTSFSERLSQAPTMDFVATLDYDRRYLGQKQYPLTQPAAQVNFNRSGFVSAAMNGLSFAHRVTLQQAEGDLPAGTSYTAIDYSLLAIGAIGIGVGIAEVVNQKDTRDRPAAPPPAAPGAPASPATPAVPGAPAGPPGTPAVPGAPAGPPSTPAIPGAPAGPPAIPAIPGAPSGTPSIPGAPLTGAYSSYEERSVTPEYQAWLDAGTGGMGDLVLIKE